MITSAIKRYDLIFETQELLGERVKLKDGNGRLYMFVFLPQIPLQVLDFCPLRCGMELLPCYAGAPLSHANIISCNIQYTWSCCFFQCDPEDKKMLLAAWTKDNIGDYAKSWRLMRIWWRGVVKYFGGNSVEGSEDGTSTDGRLQHTLRGPLT